MMVLAGPGSGKTFVITQRLKAMTLEMGIDPTEILVITFTKAAATEMEARFQKLMEEESMPITFGTFHSIFFSILKQSLNYTANDILKEKEKRTLLKNVCQSLFPNAGGEQIGFDTLEEFPYLEEILGDISKVKNDGIAPEAYHPAYLEGSTFSAIYRAYEQQCSLRHKIDFDDMVLLCHNLLKSHPDILASWQARFRYILIDEFQDINPMQYAVIRMLALPENNLFIVGDDDQSIYGFRGSKPGIMLHFPMDYPEAVTVCLPKNYRSKAPIVDSAISLITHNKNRYQKSLSAEQEGKACVYCKGFDSEELQAKEIIKLITAYEKVGTYHDIAILFRTNTGARCLMQYLLEANIPFYFGEKADSPWHKPEAKSLLSLLAYAYGDYSRSHFLRFMNLPVRYIKRAYLKSPFVYLKDLLADEQIPAYCKQHIRMLLSDMMRLKTMEPYAAISYARKTMGLDNALCKKWQEEGKDTKPLLENLDLLQISARNVRTYEEWQQQLHEYEEKIKAASTPPAGDHITLQTMHSSKGLEYKIVILPDCNEGNVPQGKNPGKDAIEEERRVFYVAMTRAKDMLFLFYIQKTKDNRKEISRFLRETEGKQSF